jgi:hypothetical protein
MNNSFTYNKKRKEKNDHNNKEFGALSKIQKLNEKNDMLVW